MNATLTKADVFEQIRPVEDPEIGFSLLELGLIYDAVIEGGKVTVTMTLTSPACPYGPGIVAQVKERVLKLPDVSDAEVEVVFTPPWNPIEMASDDVKDELGIW